MALTVGIISFVILFGLSRLINNLMKSFLEKWIAYTGAMDKFAEMVYPEMDKLKKLYEDSGCEDLEVFLKKEENLKYLPLIEAENALSREIHYIRDNHPLVFWGNPVKRFYTKYGMFADYITNLKAEKIKTIRNGSRVVLSVEN